MLLGRHRRLDSLGTGARQLGCPLAAFAPRSFQSTGASRVYSQNAAKQLQFESRAESSRSMTRDESRRLPFSEPFRGRTQLESRHAAPQSASQRDSSQAARILVLQDSGSPRLSPTEPPRRARRVHAYTSFHEASRAFAVAKQRRGQVAPINRLLKPLRSRFEVFVG